MRRDGCKFSGVLLTRSAVQSREGKGGQVEGRESGTTQEVQIPW